MLPLITRFTDGVVREFNPSVAMYHGTEYVAVRVIEGHSKIMLNGKRLIINDGRCRGSHEDPRLWVYRDELYVSFTGVTNNRIRIFYGKITLPKVADGSPVVKEVYMPTFPGRLDVVEKNWAFFEHTDGELYCVYSMTPHIILKVNGELAEIASQYALKNVYLPNGVLHGGAVIKYDNLYWHFFHSFTEVGRSPDHPLDHEGRIYNYSAYTFDNRFNIVNWMYEPLYKADLTTKPEGYLHSVTFPAGIVVETRGAEPHFKVACGCHDTWCEFHYWPVKHLMELMHG
jgi:hypothetical protein